MEGILRFPFFFNRMASYPGWNKSNVDPSYLFSFNTAIEFDFFKTRNTASKKCWDLHTFIRWDTGYWRLESAPDPKNETSASSLSWPREKEWEKLSVYTCVLGIGLGLYIRLFERSINSPLGDCLYRFILTPTTHTPSLGKNYRYFKKLLGLQCTPNTPPWALRALKKTVFYAFGRDQSAGLDPVPSTCKESDVIWSKEYFK